MLRWLLLLLLIAGCASNTKTDERISNGLAAYFAGDYDHAVQQFAPLAEKTDENFVLNNLRLGSAQLVAYDLDEAERSFLRAYEVINSTGVNNGGRTLGAVLVDEKIRIWKGEPFERAMANFYLGLIYYLRHDYNNARAAFENALFKLRDYADPKADQSKFTEYESNFTIASIMLGRCWQRLGREDLARANFNFVADSHPRLLPLCNYETNRQSNLLLVIDFGHGPQRVKDFDGAIVGFGPRPQDAPPLPVPRVFVDSKLMMLDGLPEPPIDLLAMAQDKRWQSIDTLRTLKSAVGTGLLAGGAIEGIRGANETGARQRTDLMVAGALAGTGLLLKLTSQGDVREWETLPRTVFLLPMHVQPGKHDVTIDFPDTFGVQQTWRDLQIPQDGEATYYMRMQRYNSGPFTWPPPAMAQLNPQQ